MSACWIVRLLKTVQLLSQLLSGLWPRRSGFVTGAANVRSVVALGKVCHQSSSFLVHSPVVDVTYCQNLTNQPTNQQTNQANMEESTYREANSFSASRGISLIYATRIFFPIFTTARFLSLSTARSQLVHPHLCDPTLFHSHLHESPLLVPLHSQTPTSPRAFK